MLGIQVDHTALPTLGESDEESSRSVQSQENVIEQSR